MGPGTEGGAAAALSREKKLEQWRLSKGKPAVPQRKPLGAISSAQANSKRSRPSGTGWDRSSGSSAVVKKKAKIPTGRSSISSIGSASDSAVDMSAVTEVSEGSLNASSITDSSMRLSTGSMADSSTGGCDRGDGDGEGEGISNSEVSSDGITQEAEASGDIVGETSSAGGGGEDALAETRSTSVEEEEHQDAEKDQVIAAGGGDATLGKLSVIVETAGSPHESIEELVSPQEAGDQGVNLISSAGETAADDGKDDTSARESFILISPPMELSHDDAMQEERVAHRPMVVTDEQTSAQGGEREGLQEQLLATTIKLAQCTALLQAALQDNARLTEQAEQAIALRCRCEALEAAAVELREQAQRAPAEPLPAQEPSPEEQESITKMREQMAKQASQFAEERGRIVAKLIASEERARKAEAGVLAAEKEAEVAVAEADEHWQNLFNTQMVTLQQQLQLALAAKAAAAPKPAD